MKHLILGMLLFACSSVANELGARQVVAQNGTGERTRNALLDPGFAGIRSSDSRSPALAVLNQPAGLEVEDVTLGEALTILRSQGIRIAFSPSLLLFTKPISCHCEDLSIREALDRILEGTGFGFSVLGNHIVIEADEEGARDAPDLRLSVVHLPSVLDLPGLGLPVETVSRNRPAASRTVLAVYQVATVTGLVTDARSMRPVASAQVYLEGSGLGALTDVAGRFRIHNVPAGRATLVVEILGYATHRETLEIASGVTIDRHVELAQAVLDLDGIVVTGTAGQARRREVGNTIAQINVASLREPVLSVDQLLQSRATGMTVNPTSASMGAGAQIRLRGNVSMSMGNQPLVYIDGVRQSGDSYANNQIGGGPSGGPPSASAANDINPRDIERIEVIKGSAATALYGSEAASGVIQIFTKRGVEGRPSFIYQTDHAFARVRPFGSNTRPYLNMEPFLRTGYGQTHNLSVSGGTSAVRYFVSGLLQDGRGVHPNDEETRLGVRGNLSLVLSEALTLQWNTNYSSHDMVLSPSGGAVRGMEFNAFRAPNNTVGSGDPEVMLRLLDYETLQFNERLNVGVTASHTGSGGISGRLILGMDRLSSDIRLVEPYGFILNARGSVGNRQWRSSTRTVDYVGNFATSLGPSLRWTVSWGGQLIERKDNTLDAFGDGVPGPGKHTISSTAQRSTFAEEIRVITGGFLGQSLVGWKDRYFLTAGVRFDGNSAFGENLGLEIYPKLSGAWVVSEEDFWPDNVGQFRFRGAFGYSGRAPGAFDARRTWQPRSFAGQSAFLPRNLGNPNLGPERTRELEFGFETTLLEERIRLDATYYHQVTDDALFPVVQTPSKGFSGTQLENVGSLWNRGLEIDLNVAILRSPRLGWDVGANIYTNRSEVTSTGNQVFFNFVEGYPAPVERGTRVLNPKELADPEYEFNALRGPNQPTRVVGLSSVFFLPRGMELSARGEFQGGHFIRDGASSGAASRGAGAWACDDHTYKIVPFAAFPNHPRVSELTALERARCYGQRAGADFRIWIYRGDFFKLRDLTFSTPLSFGPLSRYSTTFTASIRNISLWTHAEVPGLDPEMAMDMNALMRHMNTITPSPARATVSLRVTF